MRTQEVIVTDDGEILRPAVMPFGTAKGHVTQKILSNESETEFHCADCEYVSDRYASVFAHRRAHPDPEKMEARRRAAQAALPSPLEVLRAQAEGLIEAIDQAVEAEKESLQGLADEAVARAEKAEARAKAAEKALNTLRRALRGVDR